MRIRQSPGPGTTAIDEFALVIGHWALPIGHARYFAHGPGQGTRPTRSCRSRALTRRYFARDVQCFHAHPWPQPNYSAFVMQETRIPRNTRILDGFHRYKLVEKRGWIAPV